MVKYSNLRYTNQLVLCHDLPALQLNFLATGDEHLSPPLITALKNKMKSKISLHGSGRFSHIKPSVTKLDLINTLE